VLSAPFDGAGNSGPEMHPDWHCAIGASGDCGCVGQTCRRLVESERGRDRHILLPLFPALTEDEQDRVVAVLHRACGA
jgi:dTDP-4-amino-4,6-dideoxygalactose transaminase